MIDHVRCPAGGKIAYGSKADAMRAKRGLDRKDTAHGRVPAANLRVYECRNCGLWHVGHDKRYRPPGRP